jgi:hypothetical protein
MELDKQQVIEFIKEHADSAKADQARAELPEKVDTDKHGDVLAKYGVEPQDLLSKLGGGLGGFGG